METNKQKIAFFIIIGLIIVAVYFQFLFKPKVESLTSVFSEVNRTFTEVKRAKEDIAGIPEFKKNIKKLEDKILLCEKNMPSQKEISVLLGEFSRVAQATDVKILAILPLQEEQAIEEKKEKGVFLKEIYQEVSIDIEARATYHNLGLFINELEQADSFMKISDIRIQSNPNTPELHNINLTVSAYCLKGPEEQKK